MNRYTIGQVLDLIQEDEVAIKVAGDIRDVDGLRHVSGFFPDASDKNIIKSLSGNEMLLTVEDHAEPSYYVLMSKHFYNRLLSNGELIVDYSGNYCL